MNDILYLILLTYSLFSLLAFFFLLTTCLPDIIISFRFFLDWCELFKVVIMFLFPISTLVFFLLTFLSILFTKFLDFSLNCYPFRSNKKDKNKINLDKN